MKLPVTILGVELHVSFTGTKTYTISGSKYGYDTSIQLSEPEWNALCEAIGHKLSVGEELVVELPGDLPDEDEEAEQTEPEPAEATPLEDPAEPEAPEPASKDPPEDGSLCPVCGEGHLYQGACDECGWDEAEGIQCPEGLVRPLEDPDKCKGCSFLKRAYGDHPQKCRWDQWVENEEAEA